MHDREKVTQMCKEAIDSGEPQCNYEFYYSVIALLKEQDTLLKEYRNTIKDGYEALTNATKIIKSEPQIVRCKDCKAWKQYDDMNLGACELYPEYNKMGDWFCNFGERKEGR